jgi:hypothetical protein
MIIIKAVIIFFYIICIQGCAKSYGFNGVSYQEPSEAKIAMNDYYNNMITKIDPLPQYLSDKNLKIGILNFETMRSVISKVVKKNTSKTEIDLLAYQLYNDTSSKAKSIKKRKIYLATKIIETNGVHLQPTDNVDVYYMYVPPSGIFDSYLSSTKNGKEKFKVKKLEAPYSMKTMYMNVINIISEFATKNRK